MIVVTNADHPRHRPDVRKVVHLLVREPELVVFKASSAVRIEVVPEREQELGLKFLGRDIKALGNQFLGLLGAFRVFAVSCATGNAEVSEAEKTQEVWHLLHLQHPSL
eukprot:CAMPEP_0167796830 /NCGR_PEP_ID=MMETSP0111_2-20121227/15285_1 /TAXON_ID=91324 /ORGANISM="Lotharella globosa, Strain CCCM811" /LENGTH=107 /DNA_ID=CAMNT_0007690805 /DNA_START=881 /DNA_END=1201 /DNA_ORIENTATION=+